MRVMRDQSGFTLIEMMVSILVMGILMGIAIPTIQLQIARQELESAGREVVGVLRAARDSAINEGIPRYVLFRDGNDSYQLYRFDGTSWVADRNEVPLTDSVSFTNADITFPGLAPAPFTPSVPPHAAYFDTRGRYSAAAGNFTITLRGRMGKRLTITVHPQTGAVTGI